MKIKGLILPRKFYLPRSALRDIAPLTGLFLFNSVDFSRYDQLAYESNKPWLLLVWLYGLAGLVPLIWRNEAPVTVFVTQWLLAVAAWPILSYYTPVVGIMGALYAVSVRRDRWLSLLALLASFVPFGLDGVMVFKQHLNFAAGLSASVYCAIFFILVAGGVWGAGRVTRASNRRLQKTENERDEAKKAVADQRKALARELHDIVSHAVTVMVVQAGGAARIAETDPRQVTQSLVHIETAGRQAMVELQRLLGVLNASDAPNRGAISGERGPQPGLGDLGAFLDSLRDVGLLVTVHAEGTPRELDPSVDLAAYRIVQEALTNILKHAGIDTNPHLRLTWKSRHLHIQVDNDINPMKIHHGQGLSGGHGLLGLHERVRAVGGQLHAEPRQDGYRLTATLPLAVNHSTDTLQPQSRLSSSTLCSPVNR
jgi:signal transduction histidine kinase